MKQQEAAVYREIQKSAENAMKAIDTISGKVSDEDFALRISRQSLEYAEIYHEAARQLVEAKAERYQGTALSDALLRTGIHCNTLLNTSVGHIAELMIRENYGGILAMEKALKHNERAGEGSVALAKQLIDCEERNIADLKAYL